MMLSFKLTKTLLKWHILFSNSYVIRTLNIIRNAWLFTETRIEMYIVCVKASGFMSLRGSKLLISNAVMQVFRNAQTYLL